MRLCPHDNTVYRLCLVTSDDNESGKLNVFSAVFAKYRNSHKKNTFVQNNHRSFSCLVLGRWFSLLFSSFFIVVVWRFCFCSVLCVFSFCLAGFCVFLLVLVLFFVFSSKIYSNVV